MCNLAYCRVKFRKVLTSYFCLFSLSMWSNFSDSRSVIHWCSSLIFSLQQKRTRESNDWKVDVLHRNTPLQVKFLFGKRIGSRSSCSVLHDQDMFKSNSHLHTIYQPTRKSLTEQSCTLRLWVMNLSRCLVSSCRGSDVPQLVFTQMVDVECLASSGQDLLLLLSLCLLLSSSLLVSLSGADTLTQLTAIAFIISVTTQHS